MADSIVSLGHLQRLQPLAPPMQTDASQSSGSGFAGLLSGMIERNHQANTTANNAIQDLASGKAQDLHSVTLALAQADTSFRLILELRNRVSDAFQEIARMQI